MSKCLLRNSMFLKALIKGSEEERNKAIANATVDEIRCLSEIANNILEGRFTISKRRFQKLREHKHLIRKLATKALPHIKKKIYLKQSGGFLPLLLAPILTALGTIAGRVISSHMGV